MVVAATMRREGGMARPSTRQGRLAGLNAQPQKVPADKLGDLVQDLMTRHPLLIRRKSPETAKWVGEKLKVDALFS
jgi:hypothetical protein